MAASESTRSWVTGNVLCSQQLPHSVQHEQGLRQSSNTTLSSAKNKRQCGLCRLQRVRTGQVMPQRQWRLDQQYQLLLLVQVSTSAPCMATLEQNGALHVTTNPWRLV